MIDTRRQSYRYTYAICTKDKSKEIHTFNEKEKFWYGNSEVVAKHMVENFFENTKRYKRIKTWLTIGYKEKKTKKKGK